MPANFRQADPTNRKSASITIPMTQRLAERLEKAAQKLGVSKTEYAREMLDKHLPA